jgi:hypothetical protein
MMGALFDIVNAASTISQPDSSSATLTKHRRNLNHMPIRHDAMRFIVDLRMALLNAPCKPLRDGARAELVPSFYRMQNLLRLLERDKGVQRQQLDMLYRPKKDECRKS